MTPLTPSGNNELDAIYARYEIARNLQRLKTAKSPELINYLQVSNRAYKDLLLLVAPPLVFATAVSQGGQLMQAPQTVKIEFNSDELEHLITVLYEHTSRVVPFTDFSLESARLTGRLRCHFFTLQPDGVDLSPVQPSGVVDQVTIYPFVVGE